METRPTTAGTLGFRAPQVEQPDGAGRNEFPLTPGHSQTEGRAESKLW